MKSIVTARVLPVLVTICGISVQALEIAFVLGTLISEPTIAPVLSYIVA
jgi:hypothetical protein